MKLKRVKQALALLLCLLMLGAVAVPACAADAPAAAEEPANPETPAEEAPPLLISTGGDFFSRVQFFLSHAGLFLRMDLIRIVNFFRGLAGLEPILL